MTRYSTYSPAARVVQALPWLVLLLVFALFGLPIIMLFYGAFRDAAPGQPGGWSIAGLVEAYTNARTFRAYGNSLMQGLFMGILGTGIAAVLAFVSARSRTFWARCVTPIAVIVVVIPPLFFALSWNILGTPGIGLLNEGLAFLGIPPVKLAGAVGSIFVGGLKVSALVYFILLGPFRAMDHRIEEAARIAGSGWFGTFMRVVLPSLAPAILGAFIIAFVIGVTAFDIPLVIGLPAGFNVFSTEIFGYLNETTPANYAGAGALAMMLVATVVIVVALRWWLLDRRSFTSVGGKSGGAMIAEGRGSKIAGAAAVLIYATLTLLLPVAQMVLASFQGVFGSNAKLSDTNYRVILSDPTLAKMLSNTATLAILGGLIAVALAFTLASLGRFGSPFLRRALDLMTWLPWAANGVLLGLGLVWLFLTIPFLRGFFGTIWILMLGLVIAAIPVASRSVDGALAQLSAELEEAGRISGASRMRVTFDIVIRLLLPALLAGWVISAVNIIGNLEVPILLSSPTNPTLSVTVYRLYSNGRTTQAAALFNLVLAIVAAAGLIFALLTWLARRILNRQVREIDDGVRHADPLIVTDHFGTGVSTVTPADSDSTQRIAQHTARTRRKK